MHGSFLSSSLKARLQTALRVCVSVIEDECRKDFMLVLDLATIKTPRARSAVKTRTRWHICRLSAEQKSCLIEGYTQLL